MVLGASGLRSSPEELFHLLATLEPDRYQDMADALPAGIEDTQVGGRGGGRGGGSYMSYGWHGRFMLRTHCFLGWGWPV